MSIDKPFYRTVRAMKPGPNSGYSGWAFIHDREYAKSPTNYIRAFNIIQSDLQKLFEYVEPSDESANAYSYRIHELLMRACIEIEANFRAIFAENSYAPAMTAYGRPRYDMTVYRKVDVSHHLSSYEVLLPIWNGPKRVWRPFEAWRTNASLDWYKSYNASKHDRQEEFKKANLETLILAVSGLLVLLSAQFRSEDFSAESPALLLSGYDYHEMDAAVGGLFRIKYPDDWADDEVYDFDWSALSKQSIRFQKFDFNSV